MEHAGGRAVYSGVLTHGGEVGDLLVEARDDAGLFPDLLAVAVAHEGRFELEVDRAHLRDLFGADLPTLSFRFFRKDKLVGDTAGRVTWDPREAWVTGTIPLASVAVRKSKVKRTPYVVQGRVAGGTGKVEVFARRLGRAKPQLIGKARTDHVGRFRVAYAYPQAEPSRPTPDIEVRVTDGRRKATSDVVFRAPPTAIVDVAFEGAERPVGIDVLQRQLRPTLARDAVELAELDDDDRGFVARSAGVAAGAVDALARASSLAKSTGVDVQAWFGLATAGIALDLDELALLGAGARDEALRASVDERWVTDDAADGKVRAQLDQALEKHVLKAGNRVGDVVRAAFGEDAKTFVRAVVKRRHSMKDVWDALEIDETKTSAARARLELLALADGETGVLHALQERGVSHPRDLVRLESKSWASLFGDREADIRQAVHHAYPGHALRHALSVRKDPLAKVEIDLWAADVTKFARENNLDEGTLGRLSRYQRLLRVTRDPDAVMALAEAGFTSAQSIAMTPRAGFLRLMAPLASQHAAQIHDAAQTRSAAVSLLHAASQDAFSITPHAISQAPDDAATRATLESLFGRDRQCACEHCASLYSPAAYFVDLLHGVLDIGPANLASNPANVLFRRRPDLPKLLLSCANTLTPLPFIDLVNEVLESYVKVRFIDSGDPSTELAVFDVDDATAKELRAAPQHVDDDVYLLLSESALSFDLPFHRPLTVVRDALSHLGTSRRELLDAFGADDDAVAAEVLGASAVEIAAIVGEPVATATTVAAFYGFATSPSSWMATLGKVPALLERTGLTFDALREVVGTRFITTNTSPAIVFGTDCDLATARVESVDEEFFDKLHRFVRLARRLKWRPAHLDAAMAALNATTLDRPFLRALSDVRRLSEMLRVPAHELLPLWADLDIVGEESLYTQLFLDRAVFAPGNRDAFELNGDELAGVGEPLGGHLDAVAAALRIRPRDISVIVNPATETLSLATVSLLHRHAMLAHALELRLDELVALRSLAPGKDPFNTPNTAVDFVRMVEAVRAAPLSIDSLRYVFAHELGAPGAGAPRDEDIDAALVELRDELIRLTSLPDDEATAPAPESAANTVVVWLAKELDLDEERARWLVEIGIRGRATSGQAMDDFLSVVDVAPDQLGQRSDTYVVLEKATRLIGGLGLSVGALEHLQATNFGGRTFDDLPASPGDPAAGFAHYQRLVALSALLRETSSLAEPDSDTHLFDLFAGSSAGAAEVTQHLGWDGERVSALAAHFSHDDNAYRDERALLTVRRALALSDVVGAPVSALKAWAAREPEASDARDVVSTVKAHYSHDGWLTVARTLHDPFREASRDALVAFLLARLRSEDIHSPDDLYAHLLIDNQMSACALTSRLKQATLSAQLFVQRILLNLETEVKADVIDGDAWKWRKNYRVWEANRRVLLYPENWLVDELRLDQTPLFATLSDELLQDELTERNVERAVRRYLDRLHEIARLQVMAMTWSKDEHGRDALHVIARTTNVPHRYHHRTFAARTRYERGRRVVTSGRWSPWGENRSLHRGRSCGRSRVPPPAVLVLGEVHRAPRWRQRSLLQRDALLRGAPG